MDLVAYRNSASEKARVADLMGLIPENGDSALDIGARDGFISRLLADHFLSVTALDLEKPTIEHERIQCIQGDITALAFESNTFDLVFCAEVLEHIAPQLLKTACYELARVTKGYVLVGVPFKQDIRLGRTTCGKCGKVNPPWGHVNNFDEVRLATLFPELTIVKQSFVGETRSKTNGFSSALMDWAGNPYGTYSQDEPCIHCGAHLSNPIPRTVMQKVFTKAAFWGMTMQKPFIAPHGNWIHLLLKKNRP